jgi:hypothetical protein
MEAIRTSAVVERPASFEHAGIARLEDKLYPYVDICIVQRVIDAFTQEFQRLRHLGGEYQECTSFCPTTQAGMHWYSLDNFLDLPHEF